MSKQKAYIIGAVYLPIDSVDTKAMEKDLYIYKEGERLSSSPDIDMKMYHYETINEVKHIAVPRVYGEKFLDDYDVIDWTATGDVGCLSGLTKLTPRPHQPPFIDNVERLLRDHFDVVANAYTGSGKTACAIEIARRLNTSTLIIVDQEKLEDQWVDTITKLFGASEENIGRYTGRSKEYEGKPFCIATIQTLYKHADSLADFFDTYGFVINDEHHAAGSQKYGTVLMYLSSQYRLGVSATNRDDVLQKVLDYNLGEVAYTLDAKHDESSIRYVEYPKILSDWDNNSRQAGSYESSIAADGARNLLIANIIKKMYDKGRDILVIGSRTLQLQGLMSLCEYMDIPADDMGIFSQGIYTAGYCKDKEPDMRLDEWDKESFYTSVKYDIYKIGSAKEKKRLQDKAMKSRIIFSTYMMFSKGVDCPRLSVGIDVTPRSKAVQTHGRILRSVEGKAKSIWITIRDFNNIRAENQFIRRLYDYTKSNATDIKHWDLEKGVRSVEFTDLKRDIQRNMKRLRQITTMQQPNGNYVHKSTSIR